MSGSAWLSRGARRGCPREREPRPERALRRGRRIAAAVALGGAAALASSTPAFASGADLVTHDTATQTAAPGDTVAVPVTVSNKGDAAATDVKLRVYSTYSTPFATS